MSLSNDFVQGRVSYSIKPESKFFFKYAYETHLEETTFYRLTSLVGEVEDYDSYFIYPH